MIAIVFAVILVGGARCVWASPSLNQEQIVQEAQRFLTCETSADCEAISIGSKACGGPVSYVVTSKKNPKFEELKAAAAKLTKEQAAANLAQGLMSTCNFVPRPAVECVSHVCVTVGRRYQAK